MPPKRKYTRKTVAPKGTNNPIELPAQISLGNQLGIGEYLNKPNEPISRSIGLTIYSSIYFNNYSHIENTNWAILPASVLDRFQSEISNNNACFKIINEGLEVYVCALEFTAEDRNIVISTQLLEELSIQPGSQTVITMVDPPQASHLKLMPLSKQFFEVEDVLELLETSVKNHYKVLMEGQVIYCRYFDELIPLKIVSMDPYYICRTNDTDLNIDFIENPDFIEATTKENPIENSISSGWDTIPVNEEKQPSYFSKLGNGNSLSNSVNTILSPEEIRRKRLEKLQYK